MLTVKYDIFSLLIKMLFIDLKMEWKIHIFIVS